MSCTVHYVDIVIILIIVMGLGAQPPGTRRFRRVRNYKNNQLLKGLGGNFGISRIYFI